MRVPTFRRPSGVARLTIRSRLTLLYVALFVVTGAALLILINLLVNTQLRASAPPFACVVEPMNPGTITAPPTPTPEQLEQCQLAVPEAGPTMVSLENAAQAIEAARSQAVRVLLTQSAIGLAVMTVLAAALCWIVAGRALRPVRRITAVAEQLSQQNLDERIALHGPRDEIKTLADTFDSMLDRLAAAFQGERLFIANASHELRTPLTVIRTAAEVALAKPTRPEHAYRQTLTTTLEAVQRAERLLEGLLRLARTQHRLGDRLRCDLAEIVAGEAGPLRSSGLDLDLDLQPALLDGDPVLVQLLVRNLLDNAVIHNIPGGWVSVRTGQVDGRSRLRVENSGRHIDHHRAVDLLQPFNRGDSSRRSTGQPNQGFGLGLALVRAITVAHDGTCQVTARESGGLRVVVDFPALSPEGPSTPPAEPGNDHAVTRR